MIYSWDGNRIYAIHKFQQEAKRQNIMGFAIIQIFK